MGRYLMPVPSKKLVDVQRAGIIEDEPLVHPEKGGIRKEWEDTYLFRLPVSFSHILAILQHRQDLLDGRLLLLQLLHLERLSSSPGLLDQVLKCLLHELDILDPQLFTDDLEIADRIDVAFDVNDLRIVEAPHHLEYRIHGSDMG